VQRRVAEAARLGIERAIVPMERVRGQAGDAALAGIEVHPVAGLHAALTLLDLGRAADR
jgi:hypothetical protein